MWVLYIFLYIVIAAIVSSICYFVKLSDKKMFCDDDMTYPLAIGLAWPIAAPFALGLYIAAKISEGGDKE